MYINVIHFYINFINSKIYEKNINSNNIKLLAYYFIDFRKLYLLSFQNHFVLENIDVLNRIKWHMLQRKREGKKETKREGTSCSFAFLFLPHAYACNHYIT